MYFCFPIITGVVVWGFIRFNDWKLKLELSNTKLQEENKLLKRQLRNREQGFELPPQNYFMEEDLQLFGDLEVPEMRKPDASAIQWQ